MVGTALDSRPGVASGQSGVRPLGFIGLGVMGEPLCRSLARKCGRRVLAYDALREVGTSLAYDGIQSAYRPRDAADTAKIIFLELPCGSHVAGVFRGTNDPLNAVPQD